MFSRLKYSVTFPPTEFRPERTLKRDLDLTAGLTHITGPNEVGKSFFIEMIRFILFGTPALRGSAGDYKTLEAYGEFTVRGEFYRVEREIDKAKIWRDQELIAIGVRPVNQKIFSILGYGMDVFDIAHVTNQGDVERIGNMLPGERKKMVDQVIGVDRIDTVLKWVSEQTTLTNKEIEVLNRKLGAEPAPPETPADLFPIPSLEEKITGLRAKKQTHDELRGWLSHVKTKPVMPEKPAGSSIEELTVILAQDDVVAAEEARIRKMATIDFDPEAVRAEWELYDRAAERARFVQQNPRATVGVRDVIEQLALFPKRAEKARLEARIAQLNRAPHTDCPNCQHQFSLEHKAIGELQTLLAELGNLPEATHPETFLKQQAAMIENWERPGVQAEWERVKGFPEAAPTPSRPREALARAAGAVPVSEQERLLAALPARIDREAHIRALRARQAYEAALAIYERDIGAYEVWVAQQAIKQQAVEELAKEIALLPTLEGWLRIAVEHQRALAAFEQAHEAWRGRRDEINAKLVEAEGWKQARLFLNTIRARIKTYLVPSLSKVASWLLHQMTGGQRSRIVVDEDFDVTVDGQPLKTLSGSGKACANLALRVGLGQVLTNNVLSLFIGDEIDASMDENRASFTTDSMRVLSDRISQIILVTHKSPEAGTVLAF